MFISPIIMEDFLSRKRLPVSKHSSHLRIYGNCGVPWMHPSHSSPSLRPVAANCREIGKWKWCELKKKRRSVWVLWLCRANLLRFLWKISMGILPNSWRFQDFQTGIVSASWSPPDRLLRWSWGRTTRTLVNMATPLKDSLWNPVFCLWKQIAKITPRYPLVI
jgi:hypothetical protein